MRVNLKIRIFYNCFRFYRAASVPTVYNLSLTVRGWLSYPVIICLTVYYFFLSLVTLLFISCLSHIKHRVLHFQYDTE